MILVTGGHTGLGKVIALTLAKHNHPVVIHYRKNDTAARELGLPMIQGDFTTRESTSDFIRRYVSQFPNTKGIINNVSSYLLASLLETTPSEWEEIFQVGLHTPFALIKELLPSLQKNKGRIINIGQSGLYANRAAPYAAAYRATKQALYYMTLSFAKELAPFGMTVNMVSPGFLETAIDLPPEEKLPMKRAGSLQEVADMITYLLSEKGSYITGQNIEIAGGVGL